MKKRLGIVIAAIVLALACVFSFAACGNGGSSGGGRTTKHDGTYYQSDMSGRLDHDISVTVSRGKITEATGDMFSEIASVPGATVKHSGSVSSSNTVTWTVTMSATYMGVSVKAEYTLSGEVNNGVMHFTQVAVKLTSDGHTETENESISVFYCMEGKTPDDINGGSDTPIGTPGNGNSMDTAVTAELNTVYSVNLNRESAMWYAFTPTESAVYVAESTNKTNGDPFVELMDADGTQLAVNDEGAGNNNNFKLNYYLEAGNTYYYYVHGYNFGELACKFSITILPHSTRADAIVITDIEEDLYIELNERNQQVWYSFTPTTSGTYRVISDYNLHADVSIYCGQEEDPIAAHEANNILNLACDMTAGTTYYIAFTHTENSGTFTVRIAMSTGSTRSDALSAMLGTPYSVEISNGGDSVWYVFRPTVSGRYIMQSSDCTGNPYGALYNDDLYSSSPLLTNDDGGDGNNFCLVYILEANVNYYINVSMVGSGTGAFTFTVNPADGSSVEKAIIPQFNTPYTVTPALGSPVWFEFTATIDGSYTISSDSNNDSFPQGILYADPEGSPIAADGVGGSDFNIEAELTGGTTYYFAAGDIIGSGSSYEVTFTAPHGATREDPVYVTLGTEYSVNISVQNGGRWFAFTPDVTDMYIMKSSDYTGDPYGILYEGNNTSELDHNDDGGANYNFLIRRQLTAGTTYYVFAKNNGSSTGGRYKFTWSRADGSSREMAMLATVNNQYTITLTESDQSVWYVFTPESHGNYMFTSNAIGSSNPYIEIYSGSSSNVLVADDDSGTGRNFYLTCEMNSGSTYYIKLNTSDGGVGRYMFEVRMMDGSSRDTALYAYSDMDVYTTVATAGASKWYMLIPEVSGTYTFLSYNAEYYDPNVTLYLGDSTSRLAYNDNISNSDRNFRLSYDLVAGEVYYIEIKTATAMNEDSFRFEIVGVPGSSDYNPIIVELGVNYGVNIEHAGQYVYFAYTPEQTANYIIYSSDYESGCDPVSVFNGNSINSSENNISSADRNFSYVRTLTAGNTYLFAAYLSTSGDYTQVGSYRVTVELAPGATRNTAITLSMGDEKTVTVGTQNMVVWYTFTPQSTGEYTVYSTGINNNCDPYATIYEGNSTVELAHNDNVSSSDRNFAITQTLTAGTTYYIEAYLAPSSNTGTYLIGIVGEQGSSRRNPIVAAFGNTYSIDITSSQRTVWYAYTPASTDYYLVATRNVTVSNSYCVIYSGTNTSVYATSESYTAANGSLSMTVSLTGGTMYYFALSLDDLVATGNYLFTISNLPSETPSNNTSRDSAYIAMIGCYYNVSITTSSDSAWFAFTPSVSATYIMESIDRNGCDPHGYLYIENNNSSVTDNDDGGTDSRNFRITYSMTAGTTYYIQAKLHSGSNGNFKFFIRMQ